VNSPSSEPGSPPAPTADAGVVANGRAVVVELPCTLEAFLTRQSLLPRSVVVELNGEAVAPSEFAQRMLKDGDRMEIIRIVAGG
jgi:thiamine biosynthesis protein ThiS